MAEAYTPKPIDPALEAQLKKEIGFQFMGKGLDKKQQEAIMTIAKAAPDHAADILANVQALKNEVVEHYRMPSDEVKGKVIASFNRAALDASKRSHQQDEPVVEALTTISSLGPVPHTKDDIRTKLHKAAQDQEAKDKVEEEARTQVAAAAAAKSAAQPAAAPVAPADKPETEGKDKAKPGDKTQVDTSDPLLDPEEQKKLAAARKRAGDSEQDLGDSFGAGLIKILVMIIGALFGIDVSKVFGGDDKDKTAAADTPAAGTATSGPKPVVGPTTLAVADADTTGKLHATAATYDVAIDGLTKDEMAKMTLLANARKKDEAVTADIVVNGATLTSLQGKLDALYAQTHGGKHASLREELAAFNKDGTAKTGADAAAAQAAVAGLPDVDKTPLFKAHTPDMSRVHVDAGHDATSVKTSVDVKIKPEDFEKLARIGGVYDPQEKTGPSLAINGTEAGKLALAVDELYAKTHGGKHAGLKEELAAFNADGSAIGATVASAAPPSATPPKVVVAAAGAERK